MPNSQTGIVRIVMRSGPLNPDLRITMNAVDSKDSKEIVRIVSVGAVLNTDRALYYLYYLHTATKGAWTPSAQTNHQGDQI
jgi:hypothetical protein